MRIATICFLALLFLASGLRAQGPMDEMNARAVHLIDTTMHTINQRSEHFNEELDKIHKRNLLDPSMLDSAHIVENIAKIREFLSYLEVYRTVSTKFREEVEDSVLAFRSELPRKMRDTYLEDFVVANRKDHSGFEKYTLALTDLYTRIKETLELLLVSKIEIKDGKIQFNSKDDYEKYQQYMNIVNKANKKLITAGADSQRATLEAGEQMNKTANTVSKH